MLKKYDRPQEKYEKLKWRTAPADPIDEYPDHAIATTCWDMAEESNFLATGGRDGVIKLRNRQRIRAVDDVKAHAVFNGGVTALCYSNTRSVIYSGGGDGQFLVWNLGSNPNPAQPIEAEDGGSDDIPNVKPVKDSQAIHFMKDLEEEFLKSEIPRKEEYRNMM